MDLDNEWTGYTNKNKIIILFATLFFTVLFILDVIHFAKNDTNTDSIKSLKLLTKLTQKESRFRKMDTFHSVIPFQTPFRLILAGPSGSGKTTFIKQLLKDKTLMMQPQPNTIMWFYAEYQDWYVDFPDIKFVKGIPSNDTVGNNNKSTLIILDDLFQYLNKSMTQLFACDSHHRNISVIFITQNIFYKGSEHRNISLNSTHIVLFKNPRDKSQIMHLARQMYPENTSFLIDAFRDATKQPYSYLLIDLTVEIEEKYRLRTNIFSNTFTSVYLPKL